MTIGNNFRCKETHLTHDDYMILELFYLKDTKHDKQHVFKK